MNISHLFRRRPEYDPPEPDAEPVSEPDAAADFDALQALADIRHNETIKAQYVELRATIEAEIAAIRDTRAKKAQLAETVNDAPAFMLLYAEIDQKRDISERREAALQRQLITIEKSIYTCEKRIAKARQKLAK